MKIATFNVNGINGRLPVLLRWLEEAQPEIVCLQELKAPDVRFPKREIEKAGYGAIWHGQKAWNGVAILARGREPIETRRGLPSEPDDEQSRFIEAAVDGMLIGCLYLPNGSEWKAVATTPCTLAVCLAPGKGNHPARRLGPEGIDLTPRGTGANTRHVNNIATADKRLEIRNKLLHIDPKMKKALRLYRHIQI